MEILIVIFIMAAPFVAMIIDKKTRQDKNTPQVVARPITEEEETTPEEEGRPAIRRRKATGTPAETKPAPARQETAAKASGDAPEGQKKFSEKEKLIIYSEILKPKFDE